MKAAPRHLLVSCLFVVPACAGGGGDNIADYEAPGDAGKADGQDPILIMLQARYGVRPRRYAGLFDSSNEAETRFRTALPVATDLENRTSVQLGGSFDVDQAELATNFISEGGFFVLDDNQVSGIDGFGSLGIDTLVDNYPALEPWLATIVRTAVERGDRTQTSTNELGQEVHTLTDLTLEEGAFANAGMFAWAKAQAAADLAARGIDIDSLPRAGAFFWATIYFNAGPGTGRKILDRNGARYFEQKWTKDDDPGQFSTSAQFNALWRTASYEYLARVVFHAAS